jgi:hypothetical protein
MTRLDHDSCVCAVCGDVRLHTLVSSSNQLGPPDFDTRPAEMLRGTLLFWVTECMSCGYAAPGIQAADARAIPIVRSVEYQHFRSNPGVREDARRFACYAFLLEKIEQFADAGWAWLHTAWMCDDRDDPDGARHARAEAIRLWKRGKSAGQSFMEKQIEEFALVTDVLRRTGDFDAAREACLEALTLDKIPVPVEDMLRRQLTLIQQKDTAAHSMAELERPQEGKRVTLN